MKTSVKDIKEVSSAFLKSAEVFIHDVSNTEIKEEEKRELHVNMRKRLAKFHKTIVKMIEATDAKVVHNFSPNVGFLKVPPKFSVGDKVDTGKFNGVIIEINDEICLVRDEFGKPHNFYKKDLCFHPDNFAKDAPDPLTYDESDGEDSEAGCVGEGRVSWTGGGSGGGGGGGDSFDKGAKNFWIGDGGSGGGDGGNRFKVYDVVSVKWSDGNSYLGTITGVNLNGTFDVDFFDGDSLKGVPGDLIEKNEIQANQDLSQKFNSQANICSADEL